MTSMSSVGPQASYVVDRDDDESLAGRSEVGDDAGSWETVEDHERETLGNVEEVGPHAIYVVDRDDDESLTGGSEVGDDASSWETVEDHERETLGNVEEVGPQAIYVVDRDDDESLAGGSEVGDDAGSWETVEDHERATLGNVEEVSLQSMIIDYIDDFLDDLDPFKTIGEGIVSKLDEHIEKLRMEYRVLRTYELFGNSNLDGLYSQLPLQKQKFDDLVQSLIYQNEDHDILAKYNMDHLASRLLDIFLVNYNMDHIASRLLEDIIKTDVSSDNDCVAISATMPEEKIFEYLDSLLNNLYDLQKCQGRI